MKQINDLSKPLVIIYSKSEEIRVLLNTFLKIWHLRAEEASDERDLMRMIDHESPSLILFDLSIALDDDLRFLQYLRALSALRKTSILALSGHANAKDSLRILASGADECFIKPLNFDGLENTIKHYSLDGRNFGKYFGDRKQFL